MKNITINKSIYLFVSYFFILLLSNTSNVYATSFLDIENLNNIPVSKTAIYPVPKVSAKSWIAIDVNSGQVLAESNSNVKMEPASLTKIMTAYLIFHALEDKRIKLDQLINISETAWRTGGSRMFIEPNTNVRVNDLLQGMIVQSGNDATVALTEAICGDEASFIALMNKEAENIGMINTNFANSTGLPDKKHISTAQDLAKLSVLLIKKYPHFFHYYNQKSFTYNNITQLNRNRLLWADNSIDGMKTGHTDSAGYCMISTALKDNRRILVVLLGASSESTRAEESLKILNWSFQNFDTALIFEKNQEIVKINVWDGNNSKLSVGSNDALWISVPRAKLYDIKSTIEYIDPILSPINKGDIVGQIKFSLNNKNLLTMPLVSLHHVEKAGLLDKILVLLKKNFPFNRLITL
ncbi:D-alanyl-D-alanine carboxypeptidase DacC [Candidatus Kinetoplastibacterium sorsogonicusi]|uniref:serine-type D-Ala-D-Ala carboxypeptidase n=1 Tax=Candidatus Kinetoplastidibacterium kentomonadis TaxID=1576550 RepID=A0A3S7JAR0_9PROT|nr:D-alanyl-D-alanine carboxypeptidase family protein [Candidatus Kinetoplastibacterium sorsogonicusi]AWD32755.1 D-alanyl-D-alanine carboxypeptidase DacC [Candidatus Kinetoplastibacterium sorsogonicusi]